MVVATKNVCVLVDFPNGSNYLECLVVNDNTSAYDILEQTKLDIVWSKPSHFGRMLCKINGVGDEIDTSIIAEGKYCKYDGKFWNFGIAMDDEWKHSPVGFNGGSDCWDRDKTWKGLGRITHVCAEEQDIIGLAYGEVGKKPTTIRIDEIKEHLGNINTTKTLLLKEKNPQQTFRERTFLARLKSSLVSFFGMVS